MQVNLLAFAQARDQLGWAERIVECAPEWRLALVLLSAPQRSALLLRVLITGQVTTRQAITAPPLR